MAPLLVSIFAVSVPLTQSLVVDKAKGQDRNLTLDFITAPNPRRISQCCVNLQRRMFRACVN